MCCDRVHKNRAATLSGIFQITLAMMVVVDVIRRFVWEGSPESGWMMAMHKKTVGSAA